MYFPSFPLHQPSTLHRQQQQRQAPEFPCELQFATRERSHAPTISSHNAKRPSCQRSAVNPRQVSCKESPPAHVANPSVSLSVPIRALLDFPIAILIEDSKLQEKGSCQHNTHVIEAPDRESFPLCETKQLASCIALHPVSYCTHSPFVSCHSACLLKKKTRRCLNSAQLFKILGYSSSFLPSALLTSAHFPD